jgi:hypothetical protein
LPDEAVVTEPNIDGRAIVWTWDQYVDEKPHVMIRCFLPGAGA